MAAPEFRSNLETLCLFYRSQDVTRVEASLRRLDRLFDGLALAKVAYRLSDDRKSLIAEWDHFYLVSETEDGARLVAAMPDGELDAWARRGTPLGRW